MNFEISDYCQEASENFEVFDKIIRKKLSFTADWKLTPVQIPNFSFLINGGKSNVNSNSNNKVQIQQANKLLAKSKEASPKAKPISLTDSVSIKLTKENKGNTLSLSFLLSLLIIIILTKSAANIAKSAATVTRPTTRTRAVSDYEPEVGSIIQVFEEHNPNIARYKNKILLY